VQCIQAIPSRKICVLAHWTTAPNLLAFWCSLGSVRLHRNVSIQVVERAVGLFASVPATLVHALNLFITPPWALVLLCTGYWNEGIYGGHWVSALEVNDTSTQITLLPNALGFTYGRGPCNRRDHGGGRRAGRTVSIMRHVRVLWWILMAARPFGTAVHAPMLLIML